MKVSKLIEVLKRADPDAQVRVNGWITVVSATYVRDWEKPETKMQVSIKT